MYGFSWDDDIYDEGVCLDLAQIINQDYEEYDFVLPGFIAGGVGSIISPGGVGKSFFALQALMQIASGFDLLNIGDFPVGKALYLSAEDHTVTLANRFKAILERMPRSLYQRVVDNLTIRQMKGARCLDLTYGDFQNFLEVECRGYRLVVIDTFRRFHSEDENASGAMARILDILDYITVQSGCSIVFLHHSNKSSALNNQGELQQSVRGSSVLTDNVRWQSFVAVMTHKEAQEFGIDESNRGYYVKFGVSKCNAGKPFENQWYERKERGVLVPVKLKKKQSNNGDYRGKI